MKIAVLTSTRADYGIYHPLLKRMKESPFFDLIIIAFGTHLSRFYGYTIDQIEADGFPVIHRVESMLLTDTKESIATTIGLTIQKFSSLWSSLNGEVDLILALGDRYEMFAAVTASIPFNFPVAHIHGGETTMGAIDNKFRHAISLMAEYHFTATKAYAQKVMELTRSSEHVYNVGALSLDNLREMELLSLDQFRKKFNIDLSIPTILLTFHPETISPERNKFYSEELVKTLEQLDDYQVVITMPNADTAGTLIRKKFYDLIHRNEKIIGVENFGTLGYFSCMHHASFLLGNTSSGIIEAASLGKYVINLDHRQEGRARSANVIDVPIERKAILKAVEEVRNKGSFDGKNIYENPEGTAEAIMGVLKTINED